MINVNRHILNFYVLKTHFESLFKYFNGIEILRKNIVTFKIPCFWEQGYFVLKKDYENPTIFFFLH